MKQRCCDDGHNYDVARSCYFKLKVQGTVPPTGFAASYDQSQCYSMLYCRKCGATKEIKV